MTDKEKQRTKAMEWTVQLVANGKLKAFDHLEPGELASAIIRLSGHFETYLLEGWDSVPTKEHKGPHPLDYFMEEGQI